MRRVAVKIAYLGKDFSGLQIQPGFRTVVGDVLCDLDRIGGGKSQEWFDIKTAGRTDKGVNALDNVIVFNTEFEDNDDLLRALNSVSKSIFYKSSATVDVNFNPRHANARVYRYVLPSEGLDIAKVAECAQLFVGEHDFARFCKDDGKPTVTEIESISVEPSEGTIVLTFRAQYFLWNMIRKISAAVASVGRGQHTVDDVKAALNGEPINFGLARPDALTLTDVIYDYIEFREPERKGYTDRVDEELFAGKLREEFFRSL